MKILSGFLLFFFTILFMSYINIFAQFERPERSFEGERVMSGFYRPILSDTTQIDSLILSTMNTYHIPGLSACIVRDGQIIWTGAYGYADIDHNIEVTDSTLFKLASLSKPFVGTALMQLWENGLFEIDEDINNYLPFQVQNPNHPNDSISFHMLLTHTSSINDNWSILNSLTSWGSDSPIPLDSFLTNYLVPGGTWWSNLNYNTWAPFALWEYSNVGATLAAHLVEKISNITFEQYCQDSIFRPLGMNETSWFMSNLNINNIALPYYYSGGTYHSYGHYGEPIYPAAGLRTSAVQLARFIIAFMQKGQIDGVRILDSSTVDLMTTVQFPGLHPEQGLIWRIYEYSIPGFGTYTFCGHSGADYGVSTGMDYTLETDTLVGVIVLTNGESDVGRSIIWDALYAYSKTIPIPVELISFKALVSEGLIQLNWQTATETNNRGFNIERKSANSDYSEIGFVPGFGTTTEPKSYSFIDSRVSIGKYTYRLKQMDFDGSFEYSQKVEIEVVTPLEFSLEYNYPNPFNTSTVIYYQLSLSSNVSLKVFDVLGNEVATMVDEYKPAGRYEIEFNGSFLTSGVYFYQLRAGDFIQTKKMILLK